jgi:hypothetical protein
MSVRLPARKTMMSINDSPLHQCSHGQHDMMATTTLPPTCFLAICAKALLSTLR